MSLLCLTLQASALVLLAKDKNVWYFVLLGSVAVFIYKSHFCTFSCVAADMKGQQTETLLAGSLAKALCCILLITESSKPLCVLKAVSYSTNFHYSCFVIIVKTETFA